MGQILRVDQKAFIVDESKQNVLLVRYENSKYSPEKLDDKLALPGGRIQFGEDLDSSLVKKVKSETGLDIIPSIPFYSWTWTYKKDNDEIFNVGNVRLCFVIGGKLSVWGVPQTETELLAPRWYLIKSLKKEEFVFDEWPAVEAYSRYVEQNPFL